MRTRPLRLIAWLTLVAFVVANGPAHALAGAAVFSCPNQQTEAVPDRSEDSGHAHGCCPHCQARRCRSVASSQAEQVRAGPDGPTSSHPCPCPGGCMYCSVAKVAGPGPVLQASIFGQLPEQAVAEVALNYSAPFCGRSTPPPRS